MANYQVIGLDTVTPQLRAPGTGNGYSFDSGVTNLGVFNTTGLGIGTNDPQYKLDVAGSSRIISSGAAGLVLNNTTSNQIYELYAASTSGNGFNGFGILDRNSLVYRLAIGTTGNVGINTVYPSTQLDVAGGVNLGAAGTDTVTLTGQVSANSSVGTSGQVLTSRGTNLSPEWTTISSGGISGSGTTNYIPKFTSTSAIGNSVIYDDGTKVGIGVSSTLYFKLNVANTIGVTNTVVPANAGFGVIECVDDGIGDNYNDLRIYASDGATEYAPFFSAGVSSANFVIRSQDWTTNYQYVQIYVPSGMSSPYTLTLPNTSGAANQVLKTDGSGNLDWVSQGVQATAPVTVTAATYTVAATDQWIIGNSAGTITLTLPTAANLANLGRSINVKTITANTVISASSNVVQKGSTTVSTAILAGTAGNWATLVCDGTNWIIMAGT